MGTNVLIDDKLYAEIEKYCLLNRIDISELCNDLLKNGLNELKYGDIPFGVITNSNAATKEAHETVLSDLGQNEEKMIVTNEPISIELERASDTDNKKGPDGSSEKKEVGKKNAKKIRVLK